MEQNLQNSTDVKNLSMIRQSFANTVFTHKVQEIAAESNGNYIWWVKILTTFFTVIVLILLVLQLAYPTNMIFSRISFLVTIIEVVFLITQLSFNYEQQMSVHKHAALKYMRLRDSYLLLIVDMLNQKISYEDLIFRRDSLQAEYHDIANSAPQTNTKHYREAQRRLSKRGVVQGEQFTWSDEEIDHFLPEILRTGKS